MADPIFQNKDVRQEMFDIQYQSNKKFIFQAILAVVAIALGFLAAVFLSTQLAATGIGLIILAGIALYYFSHQCHRTNAIFNRTTQAMQ